VGILPPGVAELGVRHRGLGWVSALWVGGSAATGDHLPGISDLDLVALVAGPVDAARQARLSALHADLDRGAAAGAKLGCVYVHDALLHQAGVRHSTWTHGRMVHRILSGISRAELVRHGYAVFGRPPQDLLPAVSDDDVRRAAHAELTGYWRLAANRPWWWLNPVIADLGLTSMARGRHALATGQLLTKTRAVDLAHAPPWLIDQLRARRRGENLTSPRLRTAYIAWRDARRTTTHAQRWTPPSR
jgi:Nucleotidyltransferase domain